MIKFAKLVGGSSVDSWPQVHIFSPKKDKEQLGVLLASVVVTSEKEGIDLSSFGVEIIQRIHENYYGDKIEMGLERLKIVVDEVSKEFEDKVKLSLSLGSIVEKNGSEVLYAVVLGNSRVVVLREGKLLTLLDETGERSSVSGYLKKGDRLVLASKEMFELMDKDELVKLLTVNHPDETVDRMAPMVHSKNSSRVAGVFVSLTKKQDLLETKITERIKPKITKEKIFEKLKGKGLKKGSPKPRPRNIYVGSVDKDKRKRVTASVVLILVVLLAVSIVFGTIRVRTSDEVKKFEELKEQVGKRREESLKLAEVNILRARSLLSEAQELIVGFEGSGLVTKRSRGWVRMQKEEIEELVKKLLNIYEIEGEVWLDLGLVRDGGSGQRMDFDGEDILVLDRQGEVVLVMAIKSKKSKVVGGGGLLADPKLAAIYFDRGFVLAREGVIELDLKRKTAAKVIAWDDDWGKLGDLRVFGGNIYLLDKEKGEIYRYRGIEGGFGEKQSWLGMGMDPDYSKVVAMVIDGNIWVLTETGKLEKYSQGTGESVEIVGIDEELSNPAAMYTDEDMEEVYILDKEKTRVVVVDKEGVYKAQYRWEGIAQVSDLVVSKEEGKMFLLGGNKIYKIPISE